jgi:thiol-disulfide isomerase/thioredoxin
MFSNFIRQPVSLAIALILSCLLLFPTSALASLNDDHYDGNIFPLYAGNGSLVPPKVTLAQSFQRSNPTLLFFYVDDSSDCKQFAPVISQLDAFYGRVADLIAINVDAIPVKASYEPTEPGYYYRGYVPQVVVFNQTGEVVLNEQGAVPFETVDDVMRQVFDLLPRSQSVELRRRQANEFNVELTQP